MIAELQIKDREVPSVYTERNDDLDTEGYVDFMEFRLVYQGPLPGSGNSSRHPKEKHRIRKQIHAQLVDLWERHPLLKRLVQVAIQNPAFANESGVRLVSCSKGDFQFVSLVNERLDQICSLDILLLRRERPGGLITQGGDIDNRVKTLFDALSIPKDQIGLTEPELGETPFFYCLLENDKLVSDVKVTADRLMVPKSDDEPQNYAHVIIGVKIKVASQFQWGAWTHTPQG